MDSIHQPQTDRSFNGSLSFTEGDSTAVSVELRLGELLLRTSASEIGRWPIGTVAVSRRQDDVFQMIVDGEVVWFTPEDAAGFEDSINGWLADADQVDILDGTDFATPGHARVPVFGGSHADSGVSAPGVSEPGDSEPGDSEPGDSEPGDSEPGDRKSGVPEPGDLTGVGLDGAPNAGVLEDVSLGSRFDEAQSAQPDNTTIEWLFENAYDADRPVPEMQIPALISSEPAEEPVHPEPPVFVGQSVLDEPELSFGSQMGDAEMVPSDGVLPSDGVVAEAPGISEQDPSNSLELGAGEGSKSQRVDPSPEGIRPFDDQTGPHFFLPGSTAPVTSRNEVTRSYAGWEVARPDGPTPDGPAPDTEVLEAGVPDAVLLDAGGPDSGASELLDDGDGAAAQPLDGRPVFRDDGDERSGDVDASVSGPIDDPADAEATVAEYEDQELSDPEIDDQLAAEEISDVVGAVFAEPVASEPTVSEPTVLGPSVDDDTDHDVEVTPTREPYRKGVLSPPIGDDDKSAVEEVGDRGTSAGDEDSHQVEPSGGDGGRYSGTSQGRLARFVAERRQPSASEKIAQTADGEGSDSQTVADQVLAAQNAMRANASNVRDVGALVKKVGIGIGAILALALIATGVMVVPEMFGDANAAEQTATVTSLVDQRVLAAEDAIDETRPTSRRSPAVTLASDGDGAAGSDTPAESEPQPTIPDEPSLFDRPVAEFIGEWDAVASQVSPALRIPTAIVPGDFEFGFTNHISMAGSVESGGILGGYSLIVDPSGDAQSDSLALQALGVAITVADPETSGADRRDILASLGLDVTAPDVDGLDGTLNRNGIAYALRYDEEASLLTFVISPT